MSSLQVNKIILFNHIHTPENYLWTMLEKESGWILVPYLPAIKAKCFLLNASVSPCVHSFNECDQTKTSIEILCHFSSQNPPMDFNWHKDLLLIAFGAVALVSRLSTKLYPYCFSLHPSHTSLWETKHTPSFPWYLCGLLPFFLKSLPKCHILNEPVMSQHHLCPSLIFLHCIYNYRT